MSEALTLLINRGADRWGALLLDFLPPATLFAGLVLLLVACGRRLPAPLRYALLLLALARFLAPAVVPLPVALNLKTPAAVSIERTDVPRTSAGAATDRTAPGLPSDTVPTSVQEVATPTGATAAWSPADMAPTSEAPQPDANAVLATPLNGLAWLLAVYLVGVGAVALWIAGQAIGLAQLSARSSSGYSALQRDANDVARELGLRRRVALRVTERALPPQSFGVWRPTIVLPASAVESLTPAELRLVLAHELGHHARWDPAAKWLQLAAAAVWWFHPLVWLLGRQLDQVREQCCDELVLARSRTSAADYCRMLVHLAEHAFARPGRLAPAQAMHPLRQRMQRLLAGGLRPSAGLSRTGTVVVAIAATLLFARVSAEEPPKERPKQADGPVTAAAKPKPATEASKAAQPAVSEPNASPLLSASGVVLAPDGEPLRGVRVCLRESYPIHSMDDLYNSALRDVLSETKTNERGEFRFENVPSRPYPRYPQLAAPWEIVATAPGRGLAFRHLSAAQENARVELHLKPEFVVRGRLVDPAGAPIANVKVETMQIDAIGPRVDWDRGNPRAIELWWSQLSPTATTNAEGRFTLHGLPQGIRAILVTDHQEHQRNMVYVATSTLPQANVEDGRAAARNQPTSQPVHTGDFLAQLEPGPRVEGRATLGDTGSPAPGAKVDLTGERHALYTLADSEGRFEFHGMPFGKYEVRVHPTIPQRYLGVRHELSLQQSEQPLGVGAVLLVGRLLRGRVVDPDTAAGVSNVEVTFRENAADARNVLFAEKVVTDDSGEFEAAVPKTSGRAVVEGPVPGYAVPNPRAPTKLEASVWQEFNAGNDPPSPLRLVLPKGLALEGSVRGPEGRRVVGATVSLVGDRRRPDDVLPTAVSGPEGRFRLTGLLPGKKLVLSARHEAERLLGSQTLLANAEGGFGQVELKVGPAASAHGRVLSKGQPLAGAKVVLSRDGIEESDRGRFQISTSIESTTTDSAGNYRFPLIEPGGVLRTSIEQLGYNKVYASEFELTSGEDKELPVVTLDQLSRSLSGIVVDPRGRPVEGANVTASFADGRSLVRPRGVRNLRSAADGRFVLDELPYEPLEIMAYFDPPEGRSIIRFPAQAEVAADAREVRIVLDPKLSKPR